MELFDGDWFNLIQSVNGMHVVLVVMESFPFSEWSFVQDMGTFDFFC